MEIGSSGDRQPVRANDWDPIRGEHLGPAKPPVPHQQAEHVTAPDQLLTSESPCQDDVTPKGHFKRIAIPRAGYWPLVGQAWQNLL
jgi:hypothetical protein